jgi:signal transduction histidine kinase
MEAATFAARHHERRPGAFIKGAQRRMQMLARGEAARTRQAWRGNRTAAAAADHLVAEAAVSRERERISAEIHDNLVPAFLAVIAALRAAPAGPEVSAGIEMARAGIRSARNCARAVRSLSFNSLVLPKMVEGMTSRVVPADVQVRVEVGEDWPTVVPEAAEALYRCVQEAVSNAVKHSWCTCLSVRFASESGRAKVEVIDDGIGCQVQTCLQEGGLGVFVIRDRIAGAGGEVRFASALGRGTRVTLLVPAASGGVARATGG